MGDGASAAGSPLTFKAGGKTASPSPKRGARTENELADADGQAQAGPGPSEYTPLPSATDALSVIRSGLSAKRSPLHIKNWIACVLTLDGRDKVTKVLQYTSRLLCWHFAGLAKTTAVVGPAASETAVAGASVLAGLSSNQEVRKQLYLALSQRFGALYKSLVNSRKAFRMGRSIIEMDKIKSMGWGEYLGYMLTHPLADGAANEAGGDDEKDVQKIGEMGNGIHSLSRYDTHPIPEEGEESHDEDEGDDEASWSEGDSGEEEKKLESPPRKVASRPGRPKLPTKVSSNIGWGPSTTSEAATSALTPTKQSAPKPSARPPPPRTVSEMGRRMYRPFPERSSSVGSSYNQVKSPYTTPSSVIVASPPTPAWKLVGGTMKLLGLMGFWAFDNLAFLTGSGFLDPIGLGSSKSDGGNVSKERLDRKKRASMNGARCYFLGSIGGLYVNVRAMWEHREGPLAEARRRVLKAERVGDADEALEAKTSLKKLERKHFSLLLALLKSCCDFAVFSNNPGVDLHLKLRGRKNHEGLHCLFGLTSAATVIYNNFPNC
ncbi:hypothetical protein ACHAXT_010710 [Thalassiosira profunda]